jgi:hypothetical protein
VKPARQNAGNIKAKLCASVLTLAAGARLHAARLRKPGHFAGPRHAPDQELNDLSLRILCGVNFR